MAARLSPVLSELSSPLWGGGGGGGVCDSLSAYGAHTPTLALPTRGRGKGAWFRARDSLPLRCAPAGNDTEGVTLRLKLGVIPGERSEGRGSGAGWGALFLPLWFGLADRHLLSSSPALCR